MPSFDPQGGIIDNEGIPLYVHCKHLREARACIQFLDKRGAIRRAPPQLRETSSANKEINKLIDKIFPLRKRKSLVEDLRDEYEEYLISPDEFGWLKDNPRICFWVWIQLLSQTPGPNTLIPYEPETQPSPLSHKDRLSTIINSFDLSPSDLPSKRTEMGRLKFHWNRVNIPNKELRWLNPKDSNQIEWAWDYVNKSHPYPPLPTPSNDKEMLQASIARLDSSFLNRAEAQLYLIKMKKAWSQKKFRMKQQDKKAYSFLLRPGIRELLGELASKQQTKTNETLEELIKVAYYDQTTDLEPEEKDAEIIQLRLELSEMKAKLKEKEKELEEASSMNYSFP